jgi:D-glycero-D-manno-heptose 1,7-bisphosphate phosphatase
MTRPFPSASSGAATTPANVPSPNGSPAVFVDRDGTLMEEVCYCNDPEKVRLIAGASEALRSLRQRGYRTVLVTNQAGIARGLISRAQYEAVHARLLDLLGPETLDACYMCPDGPDTPSTHRKPAPGMLLQAREELRLDFDHSWMIGDKPLDIQCGRNAGVRGILVQTGYGREAGECGALHIATDISAAAAWILQHAGA